MQAEAQVTRTRSGASDLSSAFLAAAEMLAAMSVSDAPVERGAEQEEDEDEMGPMMTATRSVTFSVAGDAVHEVTPYSEVYGKHPRSFHFGKQMRMLPASMAYIYDPADHADEDSGDSDEDIDIFLAKGYAELGSS